MKAIEKMAAEHDALLNNYDALLGVLAGVASGEIEPARVSVDLRNRSWAVKSQAEADEDLDRLLREAQGALAEKARRTKGAPTVADLMREIEDGADGNGTHVE